MLKKLLIIILVLIVLAVGAFYFLNLYFFPVKFKQILTTKAEEFLHRKVEVGEIHVELLKGITIDKLRILEKDDPQQTLLSADKVSFQILFASFLKNQTILIPSIEIINPYVHLQRKEDLTWNFSDLIPQDAPAEESKSKVNVFVRKVTLQEGKINLIDQATAPAFVEDIESIDLEATMALNKKISFNIEAFIPAKKSLLTAKGNYLLSPQELTLQLKVNNIDLASYAKIFNKDQNLVINKGILSTSPLDVNYQNNRIQIQANKIDLTQVDVNYLDKKLRGDVNLNNIHLLLNDGKITFKGDVLAPATYLALSPTQEIQGNLSVALSSLNLSQSRALDLKGTAILDKMKIKLDNQLFNGSLHFSNFSVLQSDSTIKLSGDVSLKEFEGRMGADRTISFQSLSCRPSLSYSATNIEGQTNLNIAGLQFISTTGLSLKTDLETIQIQIATTEGKVNLQSPMSFKNLNMHLEPSIDFQGSPNIDAALRFDLKNLSDVQYTAAIDLFNSTLSGLPQVDTVKNLTGKIRVKPNEVQTKDLAFSVFDGNFTVSGTLQNFADPFMDVVLTSEKIDLKTMQSLLPKDLVEKNNLKLSGYTGATVKFKGLAKSPELAEISVHATLDDVLLGIAGLPQPVSNIFGGLDYQKDLIVLKDIKADFGGDTYTLNGQLANFSRPAAQFSVVSNKLNLNSDFKILNNAFQITSLKGKFIDSTFDLLGDIHLKAGDTKLDVRVNSVEIDLKDLKELVVFVPTLKDSLLKFDPKGKVALQGLFKGRLNDWRNWQTVIDLNSSSLNVMNYVFNSMKLKYEQTDSHVSALNLKADFYGAPLIVSSTADLTQDDVPLSLDASLSNLDLTKLRPNIKVDHLAGLLNFKLSATGPGKYNEKITGGGQLEVTDGYLGQLNFMKGILGALIMMPEFKDLFVTEATSNFFIKDGKIQTQDTKLSGKGISLLAEGWLDFNGKLKVSVSPELSQITMAESDSAKKLPTRLLSSMIKVECEGTFNQPNCQAIKSPTKVLQNIGAGIGDVLKDLIQ